MEQYLLICRKGETMNKIFAEGNKGGDFIEMTLLENGRVYLRVGSCCVTTIDSVVPVEFLTGVLTEAMLSNGNSIHTVIDSLIWSQEYKDELKEKVSEY